MPNAIFHSKTCPYCTVPITPNEAIRPGHCVSQNCATAHAIAGHKKVQSARRLERATALRAARRSPKLAELAKMAGCARRSELLLLPVPYQNNPLVPVPAARMEAFKSHLREVIEEAFAAPDEVVAGHDFDRQARAENPINAAGCATCQGFCCRQGKNAQAFIGVGTILGHRALWPELTADIVYDNYVAALPDLAVEDACVFQGHQGCTLPRAIRSDTCNAFHCRELENAEERAAEEPERKVAIVGCDADGAHNFATLDGDGAWMPLKSPRV